MIKRTDHATHALVEMGLNFCCHRYAAEFMARNEVPFDVAYRVLLKPSQRRSRGTDTMPADLDIDLSGSIETLLPGERPIVIGLGMVKGIGESAYHYGKAMDITNGRLVGRD